MMTIVTHVTIEPGKEPAWDATFHERAASARKQPGWVSVQMCIPSNAVNQRVVIGTWETRADWEAWHASQQFQKTREGMDDADTGARQESWYEVVVYESQESSLTPRSG